ncbi:MAG: hypothetical protein ABWZ82_01255 [Candidatus Limnocylindrales bacterium]
MTAVVAAARPDGRALGAKAGVTVAMPLAVVVASIGSLIALSGDRDALPAVLWGAVLALAAIVSATCVGALFGPRLIRDAVAFRSGSVLGMSVVAIVIGAYAVGAGIAAAVAVSVGPNVAVLAWFPFAGTIGLMIFGLPALAIVVPHAIAWRWLMRRWARG